MVPGRAVATIGDKGWLRRTIFKLTRLTRTRHGIRSTVST